MKLIIETWNTVVLDDMWSASIHLESADVEPITMAIGYDTEQDAIDAVFKEYQHLRERDAKAVVR